MWLDKKVEILVEYAERVYHAIDDWSGKMPAVVRLLKYVSQHRDKVKFSRRNVFARDYFTCQYCGVQPGTENLTYDHILPRSRGGKTAWDNITTCCFDCNARKSDCTPKEAGMKLRRLPKKPAIRPQLGRLFLNSPNTPDEWRSWLYWEQELQT
jgi:5-methylcytosine-specific restriction endonuclease McrA